MRVVYDGLELEQVELRDQSQGRGFQIGWAGRPFKN